MADMEYEEALQRAHQLQQQAYQQRANQQREAALWQQRQQQQHLSVQEAMGGSNNTTNNQFAQQQQPQQHGVAQQTAHFFGFPPGSMEDQYVRLLQSRGIVQGMLTPHTQSQLNKVASPLASPPALTGTRSATENAGQQQPQPQDNLLQHHRVLGASSLPAFSTPAVSKAVNRLSKDLARVQANARRDIQRKNKTKQPRNAPEVVHTVLPGVGISAQCVPRREPKNNGTTSTSSKQPGNTNNISAKQRAENNNNSNKKPTRVATRYSWEELGLGVRLGTPAWNAHQRAEHKRRKLSSPPPKDLTAADLAQKANSIRCNTVYLPADTPLRPFVERTYLNKKPEVEEVTTAVASATSGEAAEEEKGNEDKKAAATSKKKEKKKSASSSSEPDHSTLLHHALGRLYHTMCRLDAEDYSTSRRESYNWSVYDVRKKLKSIPKEIEELDEREKKIIKESKLMGNTSAAIMEEAYRLLGVAPPDGC